MLLSTSLSLHLVYVISLCAMIGPLHLRAVFTDLLSLIMTVALESNSFTCRSGFIKLSIPPEIRKLFEKLILQLNQLRPRTLEKNSRRSADGVVCWRGRNESYPSSRLRHRHNNTLTPRPHRYSRCHATTTVTRSAAGYKQGRKSRPGT